MRLLCQFLALVAFLGTCFVDIPPVRGDGQDDAPIEWIPVPGKPDQMWMAQKGKDDNLVLSANEAFFPKLGLRAVGDGAAEDTARLNGGRSYAQIQGWDKGEQAEWGVWFGQTGTIKANVLATGDGRFTLALGEQRQQVIPGNAVTFRIAAPGKQSLRLICDRAGRDTTFQRIDVSGDAARSAAVIRKRWRPAAAHTRFYGSHAPNAVRLWIMEMDARPGKLGFYSPVTTPFGYYGPSWKADGTVNSSFNFSMWSYGRNQAEPPVEQLSHLIAIGNPSANFGGFGHEGTGVKVRGWEPLEGRQGQRQTFALRVEPGDIYDTYFSYFFAADERRWRFFGAGNKFNKGKPLESLWVGSFVEVPGPPHVQRSGLYERRMRYRGWVMDADQRWYTLDRMKNGNVNRETGLTHSNRGITENGWFYLQTGGWTFRKPPNNGNDIQLVPARTKPQVEYLDADDLAFLKAVPCEISATQLKRIGSNVHVTFDLRNAGKNPAVTIYWGRREGLTFIDRWQHNAHVPSVREGTNRYTLTNIDPATPLSVRLFLNNAEGQFWSAKTLKSQP